VCAEKETQENMQYRAAFLKLKNVLILGFPPQRPTILRLLTLSETPFIWLTIETHLC